MIAFRDAVVDRLTAVAHECGLAVTRTDCWRVLAHITKKSPALSEFDATEVALQALTLEPRPDWVDRIVH